MTHIEFRKGSVCIPPYYRLRPMPGAHGDRAVSRYIATAYDAIHALDLSNQLSRAAFHLLTAGRGGKSKAQDFKAAMRAIELEIAGEPLPYYTVPAEPPSYTKLDAPVTVRDVFDIAWEFGCGFFEVFVLKYIQRAGKKPGESSAKDLTKALESMQRLIERTDPEIRSPFDQADTMMGECGASWTSMFCGAPPAEGQ